MFSEAVTHFLVVVSSHGPGRIWIWLQLWAFQKNCGNLNAPNEMTSSDWLHVVSNSYSHIWSKIVSKTCVCSKYTLRKKTEIVRWQGNAKVQEPATWSYIYDFCEDHSMLSLELLGNQGQQTFPRGDALRENLRVWWLVWSHECKIRMWHSFH